MTLYTRRQLLVLLVLLAIAGFGVAVGHWRRARPDAVDYLEQLDRAPAPSSSPTAPRSSEKPTSSASSDLEPRPRRRAKESRESQRPQGAPADTPADTIDLNRATTVELTRLPGIGAALARRIVDTREAAGPFARVEELQRIRGMNLRKLEKLRALVTITQ